MAAPEEAWRNAAPDQRRPAVEIWASATAEEREIAAAAEEAGRRSELIMKALHSVLNASSSSRSLSINSRRQPDNVQVYVTDPDYLISSKEAEYEDAIARELAMSDIMDHLAVINEPVNAVITMSDGDKDRSKTINYKDMDPSLTAELSRDGEKCGVFRHEYLYNSRMSPAEKTIKFLQEKTKMDTSTVDKTMKSFSTAIVGVCEANFGVLVVESHVSGIVDGQVKVVEKKFDKLVNVFNRVFLTATGIHYLQDKVQKSIKKEVTTARSMLWASRLVTTAINKILRPTDPVLPLECYEETLFVLMGAIGSEFQTYVISFDGEKEYRAEHLTDRVFYFGSGRVDIRRRLESDSLMRRQERGATENYRAALNYCIECVKYAIKEGGGRCGGNIHAAIITEEVIGGMQRRLYREEDRLGKTDYYLISW